MWKRALARVMLWGDGLILPSSFMLDFVCRHQGVHVVAPGCGAGDHAPSAAHPGTLEPVGQSCSLRVLGGLQRLIFDLQLSLLSSLSAPPPALPAGRSSP